jgi:hypothetical protein
VLVEAVLAVTGSHAVTACTVQIVLMLFPRNLKHTVLDSQQEKQACARVKQAKQTSCCVANASLYTDYVVVQHSS